jgi:hypothetical protein
MSQRNPVRSTTSDPYWLVVEECLRRFHSRSATEAKQLVSRLRRQVEQSTPTASRDLFYHAEPFDIACDLADHSLDVRHHLAEYVQLRDGLLSPGTGEVTTRPSGRKKKRA